MGNLVTKITTNSVELNESNVSDIVVYEKQQVTKRDKEKTPTQSKGLFKSVFLGPLDPRSPTDIITRTPIQFFRSTSSSKFNHQELLNESLNDSVDIDILTKEEEESLNSNKDLVEAIQKTEANNENNEKDENKLADPRSPTTEIARTPIIITDEAKKSEESNLMKKITDKLIAAKISNDNNTDGPKDSNNKKTTTGGGGSKKKDKKLIYQDESENFDRFSTPPKKANSQGGNDRTPLSCLANKDRNVPRALLTSTPKGSKIPVLRERSSRITPRVIQN